MAVYLPMRLLQSLLRVCVAYGFKLCDAVELLVPLVPLLVVAESKT